MAIQQQPIHSKAQPLSEEQVRFWDQNGYLIVGKLFSKEEVEETREHMARVFAGHYETGVAPNKIDWHPGDPETKLKKLDNGWWADNVIRRVVLSSVIGEMAAQLTKTDTIRLWQDQLIHKPGIGLNPGRSAVIGWHQDWPYWRCAEPADLLTARVALDEETLENGCMQVIPGSHLWPPQTTAQSFWKDDSNIGELPPFEVPPGTQIKVVPCLLEPGQVMFHHCMTEHGSGENRTNGPRRSLSIHLMPGYTHYHAGTGQHPWNVALLKGGNPKEGDLWEGEPFPVVYPV